MWRAAPRPRGCGQPHPSAPHNPKPTRNPMCQTHRIRQACNNTTTAARPTMMKRARLAYLAFRADYTDWRNFDFATETPAGYREWRYPRLMVATRWPRFIKDYIPHAMRRVVCHYRGHDIEVEGYCNGDGAEETHTCRRCGFGWSHIWF